MWLTTDDDAAYGTQAGSVGIRVFTLTPNISLCTDIATETRFFTRPNAVLRKLICGTVTDYRFNDGNFLKEGVIDDKEGGADGRTEPL